MRKTLLIALCFFCMNVLAVTEKVTVWKASASGSSGSELVKGLKNADGSDGFDAFQGSNGNFYFNTGRSYVGLIPLHDYRTCCF